MNGLMIFFGAVNFEQFSIVYSDQFNANAVYIIA